MPALEAAVAAKVLPKAEHCVASLCSLLEGHSYKRLTKSLRSLSACIAKAFMPLLQPKQDVMDKLEQFPCCRQPCKRRQREGMCLSGMITHSVLPYAKKVAQIRLYYYQMLLSSYQRHYTEGSKDIIIELHNM